MRSLLLLPLLLPLAASSPLQLPLSPADHAASLSPTPFASSSHRPLVIWHGLGDSSHSDGMDGFMDEVRAKYPGIFVHSVVVPADGGVNDERNAGFWGVAEDFAKQGCDQIAAIEELEDGFDAIGFSQGGLFLRWYNQFCYGPKMRNLITFGAPHYGISALIPCPDPPTLSCKLAARAAKAGIYTTWAQTHLIQAQYYRDGARLDEFLFRNTFIRDMNGEGVLDPEAERGDGGNGLGQLENLVAVAFKEDTTLYPATSAHWGSVAENGTLLEMKDQLLYADDWIGLKRLDEEDKLHLRWCPGQHMELGGEGGCADKLVDKWVGWKK